MTLQAQLFNAGEDICYGAGEASGGGPVSVYNPFVEFLNMKHAYARLRLTLTRGEKFDKTKNVIYRILLSNRIMPIFI